MFSRDIDKDKIIITYILPTDNETLDYYEKVGNDNSTVFLALLDCLIHSIQNCGRSFLIPDIHFASNGKLHKWLEIVGKANTITAISPLTLRTNV